MPLNIAPTDDAVVRLDADEDDRIDPVGAQPRDADGRTAVRHLGGRAPLRADGVVEEPGEP